MAKTQKYTEDQLLDGVVRYAEVCNNKIKITELVKWCRLNVPGLEEVHEYQFTRPLRVFDEKKGKMVEKTKLCTIKIEEINKNRSLASSVKSNVLLSASRIDDFFKLPNIEQIKLVVETRETVDKLRSKLIYLTRENEALRTENRAMKSDVEGIMAKIGDLKKAQDKLENRVSYVMRSVDAEKRKEKLAQMGLSDGEVDIAEYNKSLVLQMSEIMNIDKILKKYLQEKENYKMEPGSLADDFLSGLES